MQFSQADGVCIGFQGSIRFGQIHNQRTAHLTGSGCPVIIPEKPHPDKHTIRGGKTMHLSRVQVQLAVVFGLCVLLFASAPMVAAARPGFRPNYDAVFYGDLTNAPDGQSVQLEKSYIHSNVQVNDYTLTFSDEFGGLAGAHDGYLAIFKHSDTTAEFFYTFGPETDGNGKECFYHLHGWGSLEFVKAKGKSPGQFRFESNGAYILSQDKVDSSSDWIEVWSGTPIFSVQGTESE
jgi:hypothetical protein